MQIDNAVLRDELKKSIEGGGMTESFAEMACHIASGHLAQHFPESRHLHNDFMSAFHEAIVKKWKNIDPDRNIHAYISRTVKNLALNVIRSERKYKRRKDDAQRLYDKYIARRGALLV